MKSLFFISLLTLCCNPAELKTEVSKHTGSPDPSENWEPIGIMPTEDCMQVNIGDKVCNFRLEDQNGEVWDLYSHKGDIIVLDISAAWCYPCNVAAASAQALQDSYAKDNVQIVTVLVDGYIGATEPTSDEIQRWTSEHNIQTSPVLRGPRKRLFSPPEKKPHFFLPPPPPLFINKKKYITPPLFFFLDI